MKEAPLKSWLEEEAVAHIHGWDFSHIAGRYEEEDDLPWSYREEISRYLKPDMRILDIDTGGGEFLLSLGHPHDRLAAMESYPPNVALCRETLLPLGAGDMDYSAIRAFLANRAPAAPLLRDEVILPADTADVRYLRRMTDTV